LIWLKQTFIFSIIPILIIYLIPYYFIWQDSINKKEFKRFVDLL
jgi:preprotein translocase subunit YajC